MTSICVVQAKTRKSRWEPLNPVFWFRAESESSEKSVDLSKVTQHISARAGACHSWVEASSQTGA